MHAVMTFLQFAGDRPFCPASRRSRVIAFLLSLSRLAWCSFSVSWEYSHTLSRLVAAMFNGISAVPTLAAAVGLVFFLLKIAASVFP